MHIYAHILTEESKRGMEINYDVQLEEGNSFKGRASELPTLLWGHTNKSLFSSKTNS